MSSVVDIKRADPPRTDHHTRYLLVCSGEDGVGKSSLCTNLAIVLARTGKRVCILDTDPGVTNIHHQLGISSAYSLAHVARGDCTLRDAVRIGPGDISLVIDGGYRQVFASQDAPVQQRFIEQLAEWERGFDYIFIDTPANDPDALPHFIDLADELLLVLAPRPSALSETFSLIRRQPQARNAKPKHVVVNLANSANQAEHTFEKFRAAVKKYLDSNVLYCGYIASDDNIRNGFALQHPVALYQQSDPSCASFFRLAQTLETQLTPRIARRSALSDKLLRQSAETRLDTETAADSRPHAAATPWEQQKAQLMNMPATAEQLIQAGRLSRRELETVTDQLTTCGQRNFTEEYNERPDIAAPDTEPRPPRDETQQSLLGVLQQNRSAGRSLDQLLNEFLDEKS